MQDADPVAEQSTYGGQAFFRGGQNLKLSTKAAVFKRVSLLIGGPKRVNWGGQACQSEGTDQVPRLALALGRCKTLPF